MSTSSFSNKLFWKIKGSIGISFFAIINFFGPQYFFRFRDIIIKRIQHDRKDSFSYLFKFVEKVINSLNRRLLTDDLVRSGVYYLSDRQGYWYRLHEYIFDKYVKQPIDYLEFGVYRGQSIRWYLLKLAPESNLYGFDSFEGLPEEWISYGEKGRFNCDGHIPDIAAPNLRFIKGWFEESLTPFLASTILNPRLVIHIDADLYSSTIYILRIMKDYLAPGTIVIFDEYWVVKDEFMALKDFISATGKKFEYLAITDTRAAIRFTS